MSKCLNSVLFKTPAISPSPLSVVLGPGRGVASFMSWINGLWWWWLTRLALLPRPRFALLRNRNRQWEWEWQARAFTNWSGPGPLLSRRWRGQSHRASFFRSRWFKKRIRKYLPDPQNPEGKKGGRTRAPRMPINAQTNSENLKSETIIGRRRNVSTIFSSLFVQPKFLPKKTRELFVLLQIRCASQVGNRGVAWDSWNFSK